MKLPNILTIARLILIPIIVYLLYSQNPIYLSASLILFLIAVLTDFLDGYIARKKDLSSVFGTFFDPIVDKMLILTIFFVLVDIKLIPLWIVLIILFREFLVTGVRQLCAKKKVVGANWMGKTKFIFQMIVILYAQIFLIMFYTGNTIFFINMTILFYLALTMALVSMAFALNFVYWHKEEIIKDI